MEDRKAFTTQSVRFEDSILHINLNVETQSMVESILQSSVAAIFFVMARKKPKITQKFNELIGLDENWPVRFSQG